MIDSSLFSPDVTAFRSVQAPAERKLCTDCGISRTSSPARCGAACQFIKPDYPLLEQQTHGRLRAPDNENEKFFGVHTKMHKARMRTARSGAQWTGITSSLIERLLDRALVDGVVTVAPAADDRWRPVPVLLKRSQDVQHCRGMRMGYAPVLALLEQARNEGLRRVALVGIPCQVYALRALKKDFDFEELYVIGTPCSDNTTTENFHQFLALIDERPETVSYLEFRADYRVELRFDDGSQRLIPFLQLPLSSLPDDFFPLTCKTCVDYTNSLADITVGYMAGEGEQWLVVRNERGHELLDLLGDDLVLSPLGSAGKRQSSVAGFMKNVERAAGGLPLRAMPDWLRPVMGWLMPRIGPKGLEFARARVEMKGIESVLHLRRELPRKVKSMVPAHVWQVVEPYGLTPEAEEKADEKPVQAVAESDHGAGR